MLIKGQSIGPYCPINIFKCTFKSQSLSLSTCLYGDAEDDADDYVKDIVL